jgi:hypothetical protein
MQTYTAFSADYGFPDQRAYMDGDLAPYFAGNLSYNGHTYAGDVQGKSQHDLMGMHRPALFRQLVRWRLDLRRMYINALQQTAAQKPWKTRWPSVNWPD